MCFFVCMWCTDVTKYARRTDARRKKLHNSRAGLHRTTEQKKHFCSARAAAENTSLIQMTPLTVTTSTILVKLQAAVRRSIKRRRYLRIKQAIISLQSCVRRLFLFSDEKYIPEEVILDAMGLRCNRLNNKATRLETIIIILNLLHNKRFYFMTGN